MKFRMHENSLFAILLRSRWWISFAIAAGLFGALKLLIPAIYAATAALPFLVIGVYTGWKQLRAPSAGRVARAIESLRAATWEEFADALEAAYRKQGYAVARLSGGEADFELVRAGRRVLVSGRRWKAARTGAEPLRQLLAAMRKRDAQGGVHLATGDITENARGFAATHGIALPAPAELVQLLKGD